MFRTLSTQCFKIITAGISHIYLLNDNIMQDAGWSTTLKIIPVIPIQYFMFSLVIPSIDKRKISLRLPESRFRRSKLITIITFQLSLSHSGTLVPVKLIQFCSFYSLLLKLSVTHKYSDHLSKLILYF